ncbi:LCP family protein [Lysinibacillus sp. NPDC093210]|uniref:LCP family protein n=1 Tax=Lysinibacillus sp. NPDC093210 TaxID=3364133 RepID=UPI0037FB41CA
MEDKRWSEKLHRTSEQELRFTQKDRHEVFEQIRQLEKNNNKGKSSLISAPKKFVLLTVSLLALGLCLFLFIPSLFPGNVNKELNRSDASGTAVQEDQLLTTLITVKAEEENNRIPFNLLLTYSKNQKMMKVVSIPSETYTPIDNSDGTTTYDKLLFAYAFGSGGAENVRATVSKLFDLPIDYYAVIDLKTFTALIDAVNGIDYDLQEDTRVRAITRVGFDFEKGTNRLNGEEVVALMMAATDGRNLSEDNLLNLIRAVIHKTENEMPQTQLKELLSPIETNISFDHLFEEKIDVYSIKSLSLSDGIREDMKGGKYFVMFEKDYLKSVSEELTTFN